VVETAPADAEAGVGEVKGQPEEARGRDGAQEDPTSNQARELAGDRTDIGFSPRSPYP
jgi:hypothetical protein